MSDVPRAEIPAPRQVRELVVNGYSVPGIEAHEQDGGRVIFVVDGRFGYSIAAGDFEEAAAMIADVYALGLGLSCAPEAGASNEEEFLNDLRRVPILMRPRRVHVIEGLIPEHECEPDPLDPRNDG